MVKEIKIAKTIDFFLSLLYNIYRCYVYVFFYCEFLIINFICYHSKTKAFIYL